MSGVAFFVAAAVAGVSVVLGYLGLLWGGGVGGTYLVATRAQALLQDAPRQRRAAPLRYDYGHAHRE